MFKRVIGLISLAVLMIIAGCSANDSSSEGKNSSKSNSEAEVEELRIGVPSDVGPLNIYTGNMDWLTDLVYDKLFSPSPYVDEPQPWLAESAEQLDDKTWRVKIRSGIKWHDGEDFTAEDVKFTYEYYRDGPPNRHTHHVSEVPKVDTIEILEDGETLEFTCAYACPSMATVTFADLPILPEHIWENVENPRKHTDLAIGTGPFKLTAYEPDQHYQFEANTDYFMGAPTVNKLSMPIIKDSTAMFNALTSGEIDTTTRTVPAELQETLQKSDSMKLASTSPLSIVQFGLNYEMEPFNSEEFRQAISLGVDRESIVSTVLLGQGRAGEKGYPHPDSPWTNPELSTPYNLDEANKMLDELGFEDSNNDGYRETPEGEELKLGISVSSAEPLYIRTAEMLQTQMKEIGIQFEVESMDPTTYTAKVSEDDFDSYVSLIGPHGVADPDQFIMSHRSSYLWTKDLPYPEMDELVSQWTDANTIEDRKEISFDMQKLYNEQPTAIALYYPEEIYAYNADVYDQYVESLGFGIINKFSFLPEEAREVSSTTPVQLVE